MSDNKEEKDMIATPTTGKAAKPIPKSSIGMSAAQKNILKSFVGKSPKLPIELSEVRDREKYAKD
ncbi:hypothetical protein MKY95_19680 [Paenibacillus sp. FSL P4-0176]|uniref:hypothetical protein n=1 Tax=Paenibacillus sp. FSL P4-0176 TaxID=2921631 RepID=UPI0030CF103C